MVLIVWVPDPYRSTLDLDLLGLDVMNDEQMRKVFRDIMSEESQDGITFDADSIRIDPILAEHLSGGFRLRTTAHLHTAKIRLRLLIKSVACLRGIDFLDS